MFTVYILYSSTFEKIYIGYTSDLEVRLQSHNELAYEGSHGQVSSLGVGIHGSVRLESGSYAQGKTVEDRERPF